jgi:hypothetical protein
MRSINILFCLAISILMLDCHHNPIAPNSNSNEGALYPLSIGNYWKYKITIFDSTDARIPFTEEVDTVNADSILNGSIWYSIETITNTNQPGYNGSILYSNMNDGFNEYFGNDPLLIYKYPCEVNDVYTENNTFSDPISVINTQATVTSQAGNFSCIVYQFRYSSNIGFVYDDISVAKGVGKISEEYYYYNSSSQRVNLYSVDLYNYKIN